MAGDEVFSALHTCSHFCDRMITPENYRNDWNGMSLETEGIVKRLLKCCGPVETEEIERSRYIEDTE